MTIICLLLLAFALRLGVSDRPLWFDEACTYWEASYPVIPQNLSSNPRSFSPLPAYLIKPFLGRWEKPWMLRLPFILLSIAAIWIFTLIAKEVFNRQAAIMVGGLLAVSPFHIFYSTELRMYALVLFGSALSFFFFLKTLRMGRWPYWLGAYLGAVVGIWAHPFSGLLMAAQGVYVLIDTRRRRLFFKWLVLQFLIIVTVIPAVWYGYSFHQRKDGLAYWSPPCYHSGNTL